MNKMCITVAEAAELASVPETVICEWENKHGESNLCSAYSRCNFSS